MIGRSTVGNDILTELDISYDEVIEGDSTMGSGATSVKRGIESCIAVVLLGLLGVLACSGSEELEPVTEPASEGAESSKTPAQASSTPIALAPQFGGLIQAIGPYVSEVLAHDDGRLEAQIRDLQGRPVPTEGSSLTIEVGREAEGAPAPVQVSMTPQGERFVGTVVGASGPSPVSLTYTPPEGVTVINATYPEVEIAPSEVSVEPRHQGRVTIVGDNRVELAAAPSGEVMVSVTDLRGTPVPPSEVTFQEVRVVTPSGPQVVELEPRGAVFVGTLPEPPPPNFSVSFDLQVRGHPYHGVTFRGYHPVAPGIVVIAPPPPPRWGPPTVEVTIGGHPGRGWAKGHYRRGHPGKGWAKGHYRGGGHPGKGRGHYRGGGRGGGRGRGRGKR